MDKIEIIDKVLERLKEVYDNEDTAGGTIYIPSLVKEISGGEKYADYICEKLIDLKIVTCQNQNGKPYKWALALNAEGSDWIEKYGSWAGYLKLKESENSSLITLNVSQTQNQSQIINITINKAFQNELSPEQIQEIKYIVDSDQTELEKKKSVIKKLGSFGQNVVENVLANIITNPQMWG